MSLLQQRMQELGEIKTHSVTSHPTIHYKTAYSYENLNIRNNDINNRLKRDFDRIPASEPLTNVGGGDNLKNPDFKFENLREGLVLLASNGRRLTRDEYKNFLVRHRME